MKSAQALVMLLVFMAVAITITSAAVVIVAINSQTATSAEQSFAAYQMAEGGAENALIRLLRDPAYTGETLTSPQGGTTIITVTGTNPKTIVATAAVGNFLRKIQVTATDDAGVLTVTGWAEQF